MRVARLPSCAESSRLGGVIVPDGLITKSEKHQELREQHQAWLDRVRRSTGLSWTALARACGVAPTTILRFVKNDPKHLHQLSTTTIAAIFEFSRVPVSEASNRNDTASSAGHSREASRYRAEVGDLAFLESFRAGRDEVSLWELHTSALTYAGYLPGDILVVDIEIAPTAGDIVCAQLYRWSPEKAETVFRIFEPPNYLVAAPSDRALMKPIIVDYDNTMIVGVVVATVRGRKQ